ncbi:MAG: hypothetical protein GC159_14430 [Phycisphaera sp.]|nr:hypothetical protein [Phycisphaera sp.]
MATAADAARKEPDMAKKAIAAAGYARRSSDLQERSVPDQKAYVEKWATANGYRIVRWYVDDAISGTSTKGRDQFERMIADAESKGRCDFEAVLCYDISRFSRGGTNETGYYLHRLGLVGVNAIFPAEGIPEGDEGELLQGVKSWQARQYSVKLSRDSIRGQHSTVTVRKSAMGGPAPYGYDRQYITPAGSVLRTIRTLPDGRREEFGADGRRIRIIDKCEHIGRKMKSDIVRLVPGEPGQVEAVRRIFEMCADGYGFRNIVIDLNTRGVSGPRRTRWNRQAVKTILQNPCYYGSLVWNRRTFGKLHGVEADGTPRRKTVVESTRNARSKWIVIENVHEPIISKQLFEKAQAAMEERRGKGGLARPTNRYLLSGLIRCSHCGFNFWGCVVKNAKGDHRYYVDAGYRAQGIKVCRSTSISTEALDEWVLAQLRALMLAEGDGWNDAVERFIESVVEAGRSPRSRPRDTSKEIAAVEQRIQATVTLLTDGDLSDLPELKERLVQLKNQRQELVSRGAAAIEAPAAHTSVTDLREWAHERLDQLQRGLAGKLPAHELRNMVQAYVDRIEIAPYKQIGTIHLPCSLADSLTRGHVSRVTSSSSSHSCRVDVATRLASPR